MTTELEAIEEGKTKGLLLLPILYTDKDERIMCIPRNTSVKIKAGKDSDISAVDVAEAQALMDECEHTRAGCMPSYSRMAMSRREIIDAGDLLIGQVADGRLEDARETAKHLHTLHKKVREEVVDGG